MDGFYFELFITIFTVFTVTCGSSLKVPDSEPNGPGEWNNQARSTVKKILETKEILNKAKNVIFFIGDGMDPTTVTAARVLKGQEKGFSGPEDALVWDEFTNTAISKTYNTDAQTPDSAGTATAYQCGVKTRHGVIGVVESVVRGDCSTLNNDRKLDSFYTVGSRGGRSAGVVTTTRITHASPSAAYAHSADRDWEGNADGSCKDIAYQAVYNKHGIDIFLGGGRREFTPTGLPDPVQPKKFGKRKDSKNLIEEWQKKQKNEGKKAQYISEREHIDSLDVSSLDSVLGLFASSHLDYDKLRNQTEQPSLSEMTELAIKFLSNKSKEKGFTLFVEGGRIDHGHHDSRAQMALYDTLALDAAVGTAFRLTDPKETLIVVSADHGHTFNYAGYQTRLNPIFHAADDNTASDGLPYSSLLYATGPGHRNRSFEANDEMENPSYLQNSVVPTDSETHSAVDVTIYANGPFAHLFKGVMQQNVIPHIIAYAACIDGFGGLSIDGLSHCGSGKSDKNSGTTNANGGLIAAVTIIVVLVLILIGIGVRSFLKTSFKPKSTLPPVAYTNQAAEP